MEYNGTIILNWDCLPERRGHGDRWAFRAVPQRAAASGKSSVRPAGVALRQTKGRPGPASGGGSGYRPLSPEVQRADGAGSPMAGAGLGHRPRKGQRHRPLLPEPADGDLPSGTGNAAGKGPCLSLLLYPGGDSRCLRSSPGGRAGGLCRDLPPSHRGGDRGKKQKSRPGPPADNAGGALGLYRRPHGPIRGKSGGGLRGFSAAAVRRDVRLPVGCGGG